VAQARAAHGEKAKKEAFMQGLSTYIGKSQSGATAIHGIESGVRGYVSRFLAHRRKMATIRSLSELDDRLLHDIGLARSEIESVVHSQCEGRRQAYTSCSAAEACR